VNNYTSLVDVLIKAETVGKPQHERVLVLGKTPKVLLANGFDDSPLVMTGKVLSKAVFDHGISTNILKRLPNIIASPKCIFKPANIGFTDTVVVLTIELNNLSPIVIPIRKNQMIGRSNKYNLVASVYGKQGPNPELKWKRDGLLLWDSKTSRLDKI